MTTEASTGELAGPPGGAVPAEWMIAPRSDRPGGTVGELIAAHATTRPDAIAVRQWDTSLTYAELVAAARRLAGTLREHGVGPETRVGICVGRHPGLLVALLGVLLSGGAYVPLDPDLPAMRLTDTARAAGVACVVVDDAGRADYGVPLGGGGAGGPGRGGRARRRRGPGRLRRAAGRVGGGRPSRGRLSGAARQRGVRDLHVRLHRPAPGRR